MWGCVFSVYPFPLWWLREYIYSKKRSANDVNSISGQFQKMTRVAAIFCDFKFSTATFTFMKYHNHTVFVLRGFPFTLIQTCFLRLTLSVTCTKTPYLSAADCLRDTGMLQPGILHIRVAAHFGFHRDTVLTRGNITMCLSLHVTVCIPTVSMWCQRDLVLIPGSDTCATRLQKNIESHTAHTIVTWPNLCHVLKHSRVMCNQCPNRSQPFAGSTPFAPNEPVCRPTSHGAREFPSGTVHCFLYHARWRIHKSKPILLTAKSRFHLGESVEHVWDEMECWLRHLYQQISESNKSATA